MACKDCQDNASPEQILELIQQHHDRLEAEYSQRLETIVAELRNRLEQMGAAHDRQGATLH